MNVQAAPLHHYSCAFLISQAAGKGCAGWVVSVHLQTVVSSSGGICMLRTTHGKKWADLHTLYTISTTCICDLICAISVFHYFFLPHLGSIQILLIDSIQNTGYWRVLGGRLKCDLSVCVCVRERGTEGVPMCYQLTFPCNSKTWLLLYEVLWTCVCWVCMSAWQIYAIWKRDCTSITMNGVSVLCINAACLAHIFTVRVRMDSQTDL